MLIAVSLFEYFARDNNALDVNVTALLSPAPAPSPSPAPFSDMTFTSPFWSSWSELMSTVIGLQALFGVSLYSFMCHHSLPSIVTPVLDPKHRVARVYLLGTYVVVLALYMLLGTLYTGVIM